MGSETKGGPEGDEQTRTARYSRKALSRAVRLFKALGDEARLQTLERLVGREVRVTELAEAGGESVSTVSHRLRLMRMEGLVERRREGRHSYYALADDHVLELVRNALDHALENRPEALGLIQTKSLETKMTDCNVHAAHDHKHGPDCGHTAVKHQGHIDYLHDGHLHHPHGDHVDEHRIEVSDRNPEACTADHSCTGHEQGHVHGPGCGHETVPHGDHLDYLVAGHLHHPHGGHCDDHGPIELA